jgi:hypothetical protein
MERDGRHETAALLLSTGEKPAKVASMLNLPLSQVTRARDPQKASTRARKAAAEKNVAEQSTAELKSRMGLWSARVKKIFPQAASSENRGNGPVENGADGLNGAAGA